MSADQHLATAKAQGDCLGPLCMKTDQCSYQPCRSALSSAEPDAMVASEPNGTEAQPWQAVGDADLREIEAWALVDRKTILPADLFTLRNMLAHMVREVRASRAAARAATPAPANEVIETGWSVYKLAQGTPGGRNFFRGWRMAEHRHGVDGLRITETTASQEVPHGCFCDLEPGQDPDGCVLDEGRPQDCVHAAAVGATRDACQHWRPITVKTKVEGGAS